MPELTPATPYETISKFDRSLAGLLGGNHLASKPATVEYTNFIGESETFIVQTVRDEEGDQWVVLKYLDKEGPKRLILPPKVAALIERQAAALKGRARSNRAKQTMRDRMAAGYVPKFGAKARA